MGQPICPSLKAHILQHIRAVSCASRNISHFLLKYVVARHTINKLKAIVSSAVCNYQVGLNAEKYINSKQRSSPKSGACLLDGYFIQAHARFSLNLKLADAMLYSAGLECIMPLVSSMNFKFKEIWKLACKHDR